MHTHTHAQLGDYYSLQVLQLPVTSLLYLVLQWGLSRPRGCSSSGRPASSGYHYSVGLPGCRGQIQHQSAPLRPSPGERGSLQSREEQTSLGGGWPACPPCWNLGPGSQTGFEQEERREGQETLDTPTIISTYHGSDPSRVKVTLLLLGLCFQIQRVFIFTFPHKVSWEK